MEEKILRMNIFTVYNFGKRAKYILDFKCKRAVTKILEIVSNPIVNKSPNPRIPSFFAPAQFMEGFARERGINR